MTAKQAEALTKLATLGTAGAISTPVRGGQHMHPATIAALVKLGLAEQTGTVQGRTILRVYTITDAGRAMVKA